MLIDKIKTVNSVIIDSVNATSNKYAAQTFMSQMANLNPLTYKLEQLINLIEAMQNKGITPKIMTVDIKDSLQNAVDICGEKTYEHSLDVNAVTALRNAVELCRNALTAVWKESADKKCTPIIESLISLKGFLENTTEADTLIAYLTKAKNTPPSLVEDLDIYLSNIEKGQKIIESLHFDSDPEVKAFIERVRTQKATIDNLSPHILEWLKTNHLTDKIKLRF